MRFLHIDEVAGKECANHTQTMATSSITISVAQGQRSVVMLLQDGLAFEDGKSR